MLCCGKCFNDRGLERQIIPVASTVTRDCPTCGSENRQCVEAIDLNDYFELLCGIYVPDDDGKLLVDWLIEDWGLFSISRDKANLLLVEILDDGNRVREPVTPSERCKSQRLNSWEELRTELRYRNRFFPETNFELERLAELLDHLMVPIEDQDLDWFRARIQKSPAPYSGAQMGAPPKRLASHGRANPAGIPYLYLGSKTETAVAEVRPHPGETVCVASFQLKKGIEVVDLRNPRQSVSPFSLIVDEDDVALMRGDIEFLERLGNELTTPVLPNAAAIDYIPSQYICEFIKKCQYSGVLYSSSIGDGKNLALFDPALATVGKKVEVYSVRSVDVSIERWAE